MSRLVSPFQFQRASLSTTEIYKLLYYWRTTLDNTHATLAELGEDAVVRDGLADQDGPILSRKIANDNKPSHQQSGSGHSNSLDRKVFSSSDNAEKGL